MSENYALRYAKAQEFYGYKTPGDVLRAAAEFSDDNGHQVLSVSLRFSAPEVSGGGHGATVLWEDADDAFIA